MSSKQTIPVADVSLLHACEVEVEKSREWWDRKQAKAAAAERKQLRDDISGLSHWVY